MRSFRSWNLLLGWLSFLIAATVYLLTLEPTVSWWDCGEFIASSYKLEVGHPPGAPLFLLLGRFFSLLASDNEKVAMMVNSLSALTSAFTILFLFWTVTYLARNITGRKDEYSLSEMILIFGSGMTGALAYAFSDTFWFSAVEGEVYASSSLFTAMVFWAILKWENVAHEPHSNRWLILIAYLMGLSIGIHLLNLLAIPAIGLLYYFKKYEISRSGIIKALAISMCILGFIMYGIINGLVKIASLFELFFINTLKLPFNSGVIFFVTIIIFILVTGLWFTYKNGKVLWNTVILCAAVILIGYSSYAVIVIRSHANPPLDENNPENVFSLLSYLNREQYGDRPLITGHYYNDKISRDASGYPIFREDKAVYRKNEAGGKYEIAYRKSEVKYSEAVKLFPRVYSRNPEHIKEYEVWGGIRNNEVSFVNNFMFFINYQFGHMYLRYFMWNFAGRQNDTQSYGSLVNGNWISGIKFIDKFRLGDQDRLPDKYMNSKSRNRYYFLPLILGMLGLLFHSSKNKKDFLVVLVIFIMTGIAIVMYLNQTPFQPRERDYAYAGSFYAFCIWIGLGVFAIFDLLSKKVQNKYTAGIIVILCLIFVPGIMASENHDDHDRSGRYTARDIARNYLSSCEKNAILFTIGDNDTFPLWYVQEVEGFRTDVRVVNLMLLNTDWYIDQMKRKVYESDPLPMSLPFGKYAEGINSNIYFRDDDKKIRVNTLIQGIVDDHPLLKEKTRRGDIVLVLPTGNLILDVDSGIVINNKTVNKKNIPHIVNPLSWKLDENPILKSNLIQLDILANNNWNRPIYFTSREGEGTLNLSEYFQLEGLAYKLVPLKSDTVNRTLRSVRIDTDLLYNNLMDEFFWGNMSEPNVYIDYNNERTFKVIRFRNIFISLAEALVREGKNEKAIKVLDRCMELAPNRVLPYDYNISGITWSTEKDTGLIHNPGIIEMYYSCGEYEKGNSILLEHFSILKQDIDYYNLLDKTHKYRFENEMNESRRMISELFALVKKYDQNKVPDIFRQ